MNVEALSGLQVYPNSAVESAGVIYFLTRDRQLGIATQHHLPDGFSGKQRSKDGWQILICPTTQVNACALRHALPWLKPRLLGLATSAGFGDRLGLATPGHIRALHAVGRAGGVGIRPIFAQQSIREMTRTNRSPQQVFDDAMWGVFQEGWQEGYGADADHLKTPADIDACVAAGFTFYTFDPGEHVSDNGRTPEEKYGRAVAHAAEMYHHLARAMSGGDFEVEVSVDETAIPTTPAEHVYIAQELKRRGVRWVSLAPRFVGRFEKGVDYIGDLAELEKNLAEHAAIAREYGPYKLSLHSGSDKFSVYPLAMKHTRGMVHLKTAGTSYLEALRTIARLDPAFFEEIYQFARERYETDRASYHVSASLERAPATASAALLEDFDAREILHVTFGSVLKTRGARFMNFLAAHPEDYASDLESHFTRHLNPFHSS